MPKAKHRKARKQTVGSSLLTTNFPNANDGNQGYHIWQRDYEDKEEFSERVADEKPIVTLSLSDQDFGLLVSGKKNAQTLFMSGKLKIKGDVMKATRMEPVLKKAQINAKL